MSNVCVTDATWALSRPTRRRAEKRWRHLSLTEEGARLLKRCEKVAREANDALLAPLSAAERDQFMDLLIRISGTEG